MDNSKRGVAALEKMVLLNLLIRQRWILKESVAAIRMDYVAIELAKVVLVQVIRRKQLDEIEYHFL